MDEKNCCYKKLGGGGDKALKKYVPRAEKS